MPPTPKIPVLDKEAVGVIASLAYVEEPKFNDKPLHDKKACIIH